ncbi:hypothetical protein ABIB35_000595 [Arthrobacter sp. UYP6]
MPGVAVVRVEVEGRSWASTFSLCRFARLRAPVARHISAAVCAPHLRGCGFGCEFGVECRDDATLVRPLPRTCRFHTRFRACARHSLGVSGTSSTFDGDGGVNVRGLSLTGVGVGAKPRDLFIRLAGDGVALDRVSGFWRLAASIDAHVLLCGGVSCMCSTLGGAMPHDLYIRRAAGDGGRRRCARPRVSRFWRLAASIDAHVLLCGGVSRMCSTLGGAMSHDLDTRRSYAARSRHSAELCRTISTLGGAMPHDFYIRRAAGFGGRRRGVGSSVDILALSRVH